MDEDSGKKDIKIKSSENRNSFVEIDEHELSVLNGAVLHVLTSNGIANCNSSKCSILQKGRIVKATGMGKKNNEILVSGTKQNGRENYDNHKHEGEKSKYSDYEKINGLDSFNSSNRNNDPFYKQGSKIQNGGSEASLNGFASSPESPPANVVENDTVCTCNVIVNGKVKYSHNENKAGKNSPVVRPKSISWSRMVKQRKENKLKERNGKFSGRKKKGYIYPELCSSSEESSDENMKTQRKPVIDVENGEGEEHSIKSLCNQSLKLYGKNLIGQQDKDKLLPSEYNKSVRLSINGENGHMKVLTAPSNDFMNVEMAPLAVPEDSDTGRSSISSDSDGKLILTENNIVRSVSQENIETDLPDTEQLYRHDIEAMAGPNNILEGLRMDRNILPLCRNPSVDSLEEIGDYIETDFPSRASRLLFQSSSRSSSPSTDDEDEGYRVNKTKDEIDLPVEDGIEQSLDPAYCMQNSSSQNINSDNLKLKIEQSASALQRTNFDISHTTRRIVRLSSGAGSESEKGGIFGSDSSYVYTPETDYQEFIDSDLPSSEANNHFVGNNDRDGLIPRIGSYSEEFLDPDSNLGQNQFVGADGGATNNLNLEGRCSAFDYIDSNMEVYDPHCDQPDDDNYLLRVIYKHEKVPIANFQNAESNKQEKVFCKLALDGDNPSLSGSSDEEENAFQQFSRDPGQNLIPLVDQQCSDETDCMGVEDLENLTHALQNAVIMHLPSRLEGSSDDSSEEPIYEEIDNYDSFLSTSDNSLHVVEEEPGQSSEACNKINTLPKYDRRRRKGHRSSDVDKVMIWNEYEAYVLQVKQIGTSACGPTAILNILKAFDYQVDKEEVGRKLTTNLRMEAAPIPYYLFSRYNAGTTAGSLIDGVFKLTKGTIKGRFFHFYPARKVELLKWLGYWMRKGAVPLATLNLQRGVKPGWTVPDAWHHQMIYGVSSKGVYLTNPLEIVPEETVMEQLTSDSVLLIRRQDVVNRFRDWAPLNEFLKKSDQRWQTMNVLGQVVNVLREACTALSHQGPRYRAQLTSHITIPAAYKAGVTLFVRQNTEACQELFTAPELELKNPEMLDDGCAEI